MDSEQAELAARALGGTAWNSGGGINLIRFERQNGTLVIISDEVVCEYSSEGDFDNSRPANSIFLH
jgi:hypothetical protein